MIVPQEGIGKPKARNCSMSRAKSNQLQRDLAKERQEILAEERYWASVPRDLPEAALRREREQVLAEKKRFWPLVPRHAAPQATPKTIPAEEPMWPDMPDDLAGAVMHAV